MYYHARVGAPALRARAHAGAWAVYRCVPPCHPATLACSGVPSIVIVAYARAALVLHMCTCLHTVTRTACRLSVFWRACTPRRMHCTGGSRYPPDTFSRPNTSFPFLTSMPPHAQGEQPSPSARPGGMVGTSGPGLVTLHPNLQISRLGAWQEYVAALRSLAQARLCHRTPPQCAVLERAVLQCRPALHRARTACPAPAPGLG